MARPKARAVTHLGVEGSPLDIEKRQSLMDYLSGLGLPEQAAEVFARGVNGAIVMAYVLNTAMASRKERIAFLNRARRHPEVAHADLMLNDEHLAKHAHYIATSDDVDPIRAGTKAIDRQIKTLKRPGREPRGPEPRQELANHLASLWRRHFGASPTCDCWNDDTGSRFVLMLKWVLPEAELFYTGKRREKNIMVIGKIAQRAIEDLRDSDKTFLKYSRKK